MKILYLHQYFNNLSMPGGTRSYEMAKRLVDAGHEVHIVTTWREAGTQKDWFSTKEDGIFIHWLPIPYSNNMSYKARIVAFLKFAFQSIRKAVELKGDIVFATSTPLTIAIPAVFTSKKLRIPMVFEVRDLWPTLPIAMGALKNPILKFIAKKLEHWAYKNSDAIIALSPGMKEGVQATGYNRNQIAVIPNGSDNNSFLASKEDIIQFRTSRSWLEERPLIIYAGTFGRINGVDYLIDLATHMLSINPNVRFLLVGNGSEKQKIIDYAIYRGVLNVNLFIENELPKKEMPVLFCSADIVSSLFINIEEMQPNSANKFFDALAASKPVLINYGGWQHDLITTHKNGISLWNIPIHEAASQLCNLINDKDSLIQAGCASKNLARQFFDRDKLASQFEKILLGVFNGAANNSESIAPGIYNDKKNN